MSQFKSSNLTLIHGIRGISALIVVFCHAKYFFWVGGNEYLKANPRSEWSIVEYLLFALDMATSNGTAMVVIFFVLSGFFIAYTLKRNKRDLVSFYKIRFLRIYIPFLASLILATGVFYLATIKGSVSIFSAEANQLIDKTKESFNISTFVKTIFFLRSEKGVYMALNYPYWSLFHEAIFYILAPLLVLNLRFTFIFSLGFYITGFFIPAQPMYLQFFFDYLFFFSSGMLFYELIKDRPIFKATNFIWLVIAALFICGLYSDHFIGKKSSYLFAAASCLLCVHQILYANFKEFKIFNFFRFLGKISYTMYLFHIPIFLLCLFVIQKLSISFNPYDRYTYYVVSVITVLFSIPLYKLFEEPSINFLHRFRRSK